MTLHKTGTILLLLSVIFTGHLFAQRKDSVNYKKAITVNIESLIVRDIRISFSKKIREKKYFESTIAANIPFGDNNNIWTTYYLNVMDPFFFYGRLQITAGYKYYSKKGVHFYKNPALLLSYGYFYKRVVPQSYGGSYYDNLSRNKLDMEIMYKWGWTFQKKQHLHDFYFGPGFRLKLLYDNVYNSQTHDGYYFYSYGTTYPYRILHLMPMPTFHLGYKIGGLRKRDSKCEK